MRIEFDFGLEKSIYKYFNLIKKDKKNVSIIIKYPGVINVNAPKTVSEEQIISIVKSKKKWIVKKINELEKVQSKYKKKEFVNDEIFLYLGDNFRLKFKKEEKLNDNKKIYINYCTNEIIVKNIVKSSIKKEFENWYKEMATKFIIPRVDFYSKKIGVKANAVKIKNTKSIWGSCNSNGVLIFNWRCIMAPIEVIDYIIVHEVCHIIHLNHSKNFWLVVNKFVPEYSKKRNWLKENGFYLNL